MDNFSTVLTLLVGVTFWRWWRAASTSHARAARRGGVLVALVPGLPIVRFDPQLVFLVFIPPLLYRASLQASYRDVRANFRPILSLGVGTCCSRRSWSPGSRTT